VTEAVPEPETCFLSEPWRTETAVSLELSWRL